MIQSMMLRQRKGCYDPKDLEGVLPVLDRCLYDGGDGGVVLCSDLRAEEASADLELGLCGTEALQEVHQVASPSSSAPPARYLPGSYGERSLAEDPAYQDSNHHLGRPASCM